MNFIKPQEAVPWYRKLTHEPSRIEDKYYNPLQVSVGCSLFIDHADIEHGEPFTVVALHEYNREIGEDIFKFTDYAIESVHRVMILRVYPDGKDQRCILMWMDRQFPYREDRAMAEWLHGIESGRIIENGMTFERVTPGMNAQAASIVSMKDRDSDGKLEFEELRQREVRYWDFINDESGMYMFIEQDLECGYFVVACGYEIPRGIVSTL